MSARDIARARATVIALDACLSELSLRISTCSEEDRQYLWGELSEAWQKMACIALNTSPSVDETHAPVTAEVHLRFAQPREDPPAYGADNLIECLMALTQQPDVKIGDVRNVNIELWETT